ncbi:conserved hypothetical protein [Leishmania major strain Friedlin]|uniref:Uncharacterized protein n=1 Tax=Leishmania major TaxID=5664 RepID=Q4QJI6_LEIMA|nr:conserved hypothetical protein [Leishmania major strain Friedlin]CAG9568195.1 hypothetical_protein_-_conserved [Leishmania major strain Friedlin]CAJ01933.1 conserved hypothetical protein [Leishmania major strain Friedlin]|eukprot:XP_001687493.1 conserved hypothetical protein [Leishmania major strain Friedlin]
MVSVLVQRQQHEAARRRERLRAARQAAAALSIQQARAYQKQKRQQEACVREDARQLWLQSNARDLAAIDGLVARAATEQGEAQEAAGHYEANLQAEAYEEAAAWQAERQLEEARHRLAVAYTRTQAHERAKPAREAEQRRAAVRVTEKVRAARVATAAPAALSLSSVLASLQGAPVATHVPRASVPVPRPSLESLRNAVGSTAGAARADVPPAALSPLRRWRMSHVAPHVHVTLHGDPTHRVTAREENARSALAAADDAVPASADAYAAECAAVQQQRDEVLKDGQERAAQRAASLLRRQRAKELQEEREQQAQRERLAAVKAHYRHPHEEGTASGGDKGAAPEGGTHPATTTAGSSSGGSNGSPNHQHRRPQRQRTPQRLACHQQAYIKGEEEFRAAFLEAPPLVVRLDEQPPRRAPLSELLRPVKVAELLYSIANSVPVDPVPFTPAPHQGSGAAAAVSPSFPMTGEVPPSAQPSARARVLPSVPLRMLPLDERSSAARATAESAPEDRAAAATPLSSGEEGCSLPPPPPPAPRGSSGALRASAEASTAPSPMRLDVLVSRTSRSRTPSPEKAAAVEELVALSPLTPAPPAAGTCVPESPSRPPPCAGGALRELGQASANMGASDVTMAYPQQPLAAPGGRRATSAHANASASPSALSSMMERAPTHHCRRRSATPPSSLSTTTTTTTTETAEPPSGSSSPASVGSSSSSSSSGIDASSSSYNSASTSGSSRHPMPVMTAEQLKLALLRLRSRIRSAQM